MTVNTTTLSAIPNVGRSKSEWINLDGEDIPGLLTRTHDRTLVFQRSTGYDELGESPAFTPPELIG